MSYWRTMFGQAGNNARVLQNIKEVGSKKSFGVYPDPHSIIMEKVVTIKDKKYPELLKKIGKDAPEKFYYKGDWDEKIFENCLAVVGSRRLTSYGRKITEQLVTEIAAAA